MKRLFATLLSLLVSAGARAEVVVAYETPTGALAPLSKEMPVWVKCFECDVIKRKIIEQLQAKGYKVAPNATDAMARLVIAAGVSVPSDGKARRLYVDDVYGKGIPPIAPALKHTTAIAAEASLPSPQRDILRLSPEAIQAGTMVSSSRTGAIGFATGINVLLAMIERSMADAMRTPGVAEMNVTVVSGEQRRNFRVLAAANTSETPDTLLDGAVAAAIEGLAAGVPETKAVEGTNAR